VKEAMNFINKLNINMKERENQESLKAREAANDVEQGGTKKGWKGTRKFRQILYTSEGRIQGEGVPLTR